MADTNRIEMIGRYLSGQMRPQEQELFRRQLNADPGLRKMLEAEKLIRETIHADLEAMPVAHAATRMRVMDMLARPEQPMAGLPGGMAGGSGLTPFLKIFLTSILGIGLVAGGYALLPKNNPQRNDMPPPAVAAPAPAAVLKPAPQPAEQMPPAMPAQPATSTTDAATAATPAATHAVTPATETTTPPATRNAGAVRHASGAVLKASTPPTQPPATAPAVATPPAPHETVPEGSGTEKRPRRIIKNDDVPVKIEVPQSSPK